MPDTAEVTFSDLTLSDLRTALLRYTRC